MSLTSSVPGVLYVVATPIGNLGDLSPRAREVLAGVDLIAAEDTRHSAALLHAMGISKPLRSLHEHNEASRLSELLDRLQGGQSIALVSDAGTPLISDPGYDLVKAASSSGIRVLSVPGPCAAVAALSVAGIATDRFVFEGFLAAKSGARQARLAELRTESRTLVFYEAPHRLGDTLAAMAHEFGADRRASVGRELTKAFETTYYGTLQELAERASRDADMVRGELVLVVAGAPVEETKNSLMAEQVLRVLIEELPAAQAAKLAARLSGAKRSELYDLAVRWSKRREDAD